MYEGEGAYSSSEGAEDLGAYEGEQGRLELHVWWLGEELNESGPIQAQLRIRMIYNRVPYKLAMRRSKKEKKEKANVRWEGGIKEK